MTAPKLFEIALPEGDVLGFDIDMHGDNGSRRYNSADWLSRGFDGVRLVGKGIGRTHIRPGSAVWTTIGILQHNGIVELDDLTLHNAPRSALQAGTGLWTPGLPVFPKFRLVLRRVELRCDVPGNWGFFTYECDIDFEDVEIFGALLREHPNYHHEFALYGLSWNRVNVRAAGAECLKLRPDPVEIRPLKKLHRFIVRNSTFADWYQPWSNRGGAGVVIQGGGPFLDVLVEKSTFWGGDGQRCRCIMIDDGHFIDGVATGNVLIRQVAARGRSSRTDFGDTLVRVGPLHSGVKIAKSLTIEECGLWGPNMAVQLTGVPAGKLIVRDCNTPALRDWASARGMDTTFEAQLPLPGRRVPISAGIVA